MALAVWNRLSTVSRLHWPSTALSRATRALVRSAKIMPYRASSTTLPASILKASSGPERRRQSREPAHCPSEPCRLLQLTLDPFDDGAPVGTVPLVFRLVAADVVAPTAHRDRLGEEPCLTAGAPDRERYFMRFSLSSTNSRTRRSPHWQVSKACSRPGSFNATIVVAEIALRSDTTHTQVSLQPIHNGHQHGFGQ